MPKKNDIHADGQNELAGASNQIAADESKQEHGRNFVQCGATANVTTGMEVMAGMTLTLNHDAFEVKRS